MVTVKFFGSARVKFKVKEIQIEALTIKELMSQVALQFNVNAKDIKQYLIYVNEVNITQLNLYRTKLNDGDIIYLLSPASGG